MRTATVALVLGVLLEALLVFGQGGRAVDASFKGNLLANQTKDLAAARIRKPIILKQNPQEYDYEQDEEPEEEEEEEDEEEKVEEIPHTTQRSKGDKKRQKNKKKGGGVGGGADGGGNLKGGFKGGSKGGLKKHLKKYMFPLLLAYKLKFLTLIPLLIGGLVLIVASTGFAGFFFALFAVGVGLKRE